MKHGLVLSCLKSIGQTELEKAVLEHENGKDTSSQIRFLIDNIITGCQIISQTHFPGVKKFDDLNMNDLRLFVVKNQLRYLNCPKGLVPLAEWLILGVCNTAARGSILARG